MRMVGWVGVAITAVGLGVGCSSSSTVMTGPEMSTQKGAGGQGGATADGAAGNSGGVDANPVGNPGFGGFPGGVTPSCSVLETQYANTLAGAQTCDVSGSGQCQQAVSATPSCPSCMTYVNNAGIVNAIKYEWMQLGCASQSAQNCPSTCPQSTAGKCVASSTGGICSSN